MIRIVQVVEAVEGGCRKHVLELLVRLPADHFEQTVLFSPRRDARFAETIAAVTSARVHAMPWDVPRSISPREDLRGYQFLRRLLKSSSPHIVHCHSAKAGFLGRFAARDLPAVRIYTPHCFPFCMTTTGWRRGLYYVLERLAGRYTDCLVAVSPSEAEIAVRSGIVHPDKVVVIENGVDVSALQVAVDPHAKRADIGIGPSEPVIISVGALRPQKGPWRLVEAVPLLLPRHPRLHVLLVGDGPLRASLERLSRRLGVDRHVRLLGARDDVAELLRIADCMVMPSLWEAGPYALLEAMAVGTPVVANRIPGLTDWVTDGETGLLTDASKPSELAAAIAHCLRERALSRRMADAARLMILRRNTIERWVRDMSALYEKLAQAGLRKGH